MRSCADAYLAVKELAEIKDNGTPDGIALLAADSMSEWTFTIAVLGDETVYRVRVQCMRMACEVVTDASGIIC